MRSRALVAIAVLAGCSRHADGDDPRPAAGGSGGGGDGWVQQAVPECGYHVELPAKGDRAALDVGGGATSITYLARARPDLYIAACVTLPASAPPPSPAAALHDQVANHASATELGGIGVITDVTSTPADDGGSYAFTFDGGMRVEGFVHVAGRTIADVSGSIQPGSAASRAAFERVRRSFRR